MADDGRLRVSIEGENRLGPVAIAAGADMSNFARKVSADAEAIEANFEKITNRLAGVGAAGGNAAKQVSPEMDRLRGMVERLGDRYEYTGRIGTQQITALSLTVKELEQAHGGAAFSADRLSEAERKIYQSAKTSLDDAIVKQREFNDEQRRMQGQTREWIGLKDTIASTGGALGEGALKMGLVTAAFTEGWRIGKQFDRFLDENIDSWRVWKVAVVDAISDFQLKLRGIDPDLAHAKAGIADLFKEFEGTRTAELLPEIYRRQQRNRAGREGAIDPAKGLQVMEEMQQQIGQGQFDRLKEWEERVEKAEETARQFREELEALAGTGPKVERSQKLAADAIALIDKQTGTAGAGLFAMRSQLQQIADTARITGGSLRSDLLPYIEQLVQFLPEIPQGRTLGGLLGPLPTMTRVEEILGRQALKIPLEIDEAKLTPAAMRGLREQFANAVMPGLSDALSDVALTGGKNLGEIAGREFEKYVHQGAEFFVGALGNVFADLFGGGTENIVERGGRFFIEDETTPYPSQQAAFQNTNQARAAAGIGAGIAGLQIGIGAYGQGYAGGSLLSGALGGAVGGVGAAAGLGAALGTSVGPLGTAIGAIVGAAIGLISSWLGSQAHYDEYSYGQFGVRGGEAFFRGNENVTTNQEREALARLQQTWEEFYSGYFEILMTFPDQLATGILDEMGDVLPRIGLERGGDMGRAASANFWKHYDEYLRSGMGDQIAQGFFEDLSDAFQRYGMSAGRFEEIWYDLEVLDPKKQMELLGQLAQAVVDFFETIEYFRTPVAQQMGPHEFAPSAGAPGLLEQARIRNHESFADVLAREDEELLRLGSTLNELTGEAQIRNAARLGDELRARQDEMENFFRRMAQSIENVNRSLDAFSLDIDLEQMVTPEGEPDWEARIARMQTEGETVWDRLMQASTPEEIEHWTQEWIRINQQILGAAQNLGPEAYQQYLTWVEENNALFRQDVGARFQQLGQDIEDANERFLAAMEGFINAFLGATGQLEGGSFRGVIRGKVDKEGNPIWEPPGAPPGPEPIYLGPEQALWIQSSSTSLSDISGYSSQMVAELRALRAEVRSLAGDGGVRQQQSVKVGGVLHVRYPDGFEDSVRFRRLEAG